MGDSASNYYGDNEKLGPIASSASFLAVPELRQRQGGSVVPGGPGGFLDAAARYSSAMSVASSDREATSEAWIKRQRIKPGRAKTKKVKLTKGRFITEFGKRIFPHLFSILTDVSLTDVPSAVRNANMAGGYGHMANESEFTHMRYTAA
jgi:hypothetical protein